MKMKYKHLTKPGALKRIGRPLLTGFFERFQDDFNANGRALPPPQLSDNDYFQAIVALLMSPESLPDPLNEALVAIDELSHPKAFTALETTPGWPAHQARLDPNSSREQIAMQLWLHDPAFLARAHNTLGLMRLTAFEYAATVVPLERRPAFDAANKMAILNLTLGLDSWFASNHRGAETTRVEVYPLRGEYWYLIRHGDIFTRTPKVEQQTTEILHFRPERDDVIVYSPARDEIRVNARTKGERDLYIQQFGAQLRGSLDYFSNRRTYTLEPLRELGRDALDAREIESVKDIRLRELEVAFDRGEREVITRAAQGLFEFAASTAQFPDPIPKEGRLARAIFEIQFAAAARPYPVEIRVPNILKMSRRCDPLAVQSWLTHRGFRRAPESELLVPVGA